MAGLGFLLGGEASSSSGPESPFCRVSGFGSEYKTWGLEGFNPMELKHYTQHGV